VAIYRINKEVFGRKAEAKLVDRLRATGQLIRKASCR
jgi:predicted N-acetyltransferase YhbS